MSTSEATQIFTNQATVNAQTNINKPTLRRGNQGLAVQELPEFLVDYNTYRGLINGIFEISVEKAVKTFQHRVFLFEDGIVGLLTWQGLYTGAPVNMPMLQRGDQSEIVIPYKRFFTYLVTLMMCVMAYLARVQRLLS